MVVESSHGLILPDQKKEPMKTALITGATAGIGEAIAHRFAKENWNLIITGRRGERLQELANRLHDEYEVRVLAISFDVRSFKQVENALGKLPAGWQTIDVLVNNAGLAVGMNPVQDGVVDDWERMIDTNLKGLLYVTRVISPTMIARGSGHIVNIGSIAGKEVYPNGNVYCATKFAVDALTKGIRQDMYQQGIKVTAVHPGLVETEFSIVRFKGDEEKAGNVYKGLVPLYGDDIADAVWYAVSRPESVNISEIVITPTAQAGATLVKRG